MPKIELKANYYRVRQKNPQLFTNFKTIRLNNGILIIKGKNNQTKKFETQTILFDKNKWNNNSILKWIKKNKFKILAKNIAKPNFFSMALQKMTRN